MQDKTISICYAVSDTNDPFSVKGYISRKTGSIQKIFDSTLSSSVFRIRGDTIKPVDSVRFIVAAQLRYDYTT